MKKIIRNIIAFVFFFIGVIGGFIPILQGWMFILAGFIILDIKNKKEYEEKIIKIFRKTKIGRGLTDLWSKVKNLNKDVIVKDKEEKIRYIFKDIKKDNQ